jgi:hypothetical protein
MGQTTEDHCLLVLQFSLDEVAIKNRNETVHSGTRSETARTLRLIRL